MKKMYVFSALCIIFVVMKHIGHDIVHEPLTYTPVWRIPAFMFISGYFFKREYSNNILKFFYKKVKSLIIPLYGWSLFYGIMVYLFQSFGLINFGDKITIASFFVDTFLHSHNYGYNSAMWFLSALFLVEILYIMFCKLFFNKFRGDITLLVMFVILNISSVNLARYMYIYELDTIKWIHFLKSTYFIVFFHLGQLYKIYIEHKDGFSFYKLVIPLVINMSIATFFCGDTQDISRIELLYFDSSWMFFTNSNAWVPLVTSMTSIYFWLKVAELISKSISDGDLIVKIGKNTLGIMTHHIFCFWLINSIIYYIIGYKGFNYDLYMNDVWYKIIDYWPFSNMIYLLGGVIGSIYITQIFTYIKNKLLKNFKVIKNESLGNRCLWSAWL